MNLFFRGSISDPYIKFQYYFKQIENATFDKMMNLYTTKSKAELSQKILYPITDILNKFTESDIKILGLIFPLSQLTHQIHEKYMFKITKTEAESEDLLLNKEEKNNTIYQRYQNCNTIIEEILKLSLPENPAIEAIRAIQPLFKERARISEYVIDSSAEKCKIKEALIQICKKHNSFIKKFDEIVANNSEKSHFKKATIFSLTEEENPYFQQNRYL